MKFLQQQEKLYKFYEAFRDTNNKFTVNEIEIKRFKTIEENNIKDGDIVVLETIQYNNIKLFIKINIKRNFIKLIYF